MARPFDQSIELTLEKSAEREMFGIMDNINELSKQKMLLRRPANPINCIICTIN